jgi:hypothetical protein
MYQQESGLRNGEIYSEPVRDQAQPRQICSHASAASARPTAIFCPRFSPGPTMCARTSAKTSLGPRSAADHDDREHE